MPTNRTLSEQVVLRLDERSLRGFAKLQRGAGELRVFVPYTSPELTRLALAKATALTKNLAAHITLFTMHAVPFPLPPNSLVVIATKRSWWPTAEVKLARALARAGHSVALLGV
jgi:hypothetical protein